MAIVGRFIRFAALLVLLVVMFAGGWAVGRLGLGSTVPTASLTDLERQFSERMKGSSLVGHFTVSGRTKGAAEEDRYDIASVEKVADDRWRFNVRMRHGTFDMSLPVVVPVKWVEDTPVVTLTDWEIPPSRHIHVQSALPRRPLRGHVAARQGGRVDVRKD